MYASKTPRDLNHDPYPNVWDGHTEFNQMRADVDTFRKGAPGRRIGDMNYQHRPRPEYDHEQHNQPNPVLVGIRESSEQGWAYWLPAFDLYAEDEGDWMLPDCLYDARPEHVDHARRVLERLARMGQA